VKKKRRKRKFNWKGLGGFILKAGIVYSLLMMLLCQVEFNININKKKTGIIQNLTNIADNVYSGYKSLTTVK